MTVASTLLTRGGVGRATLVFILAIGTMSGALSGYQDPAAVDELAPQHHATDVHAEMLDGDTEPATDRGPLVAAVETIIPDTGPVAPALDRAIEPIVTRGLAEVVYGYTYVAFTAAQTGARVGAAAAGVGIPAWLFGLAARGLNLLAVGLYVTYALYNITNRASGGASV